MHHTDIITKKEALALGIIDSEGLGFIKPQTAFKNITEQILAEIKKGNLVWRQGWRSGVIIKGKTYGAQNYETQRPYTGGNAFFINMQNLLNGTNYNFFLTHKQIRERGASLKKGAKAFPVSVFIKNITVKEIKVKGETKQVNEEEVGVIWYYVYPIDMVEGLKEIKRKTHKPDTFNEIIISDADTIINNMPSAPSIKHGGDKAFYTPTSDYVQMPHKKAFKVQQEYYSVLFHELMHSTGHSKRLDRGNNTRRRDGSVEDKKAYAFEELIAELGSAFLCGVCEIEYFTVNNSAAYLKGWASRLTKEIEADPNFLKRAVFKAVRGANYIIGTTLEKHGVIVKYGEKKEVTKPKEKHYAGKEITPNKTVKTSVNKAIEDLISIDSKLKNIGAMALGMLFSSYKNDNFPDTNEGLKGKLFEKMEQQGIVEYMSRYELTDYGLEIVKKIQARLETLKAKKSGTDLFPELSGVTDAVLIFINAFLSLHNKTVSKEELIFILTNFQNAIKGGLIKAKHPLSIIANTTQDKLVRLINSLNPNEKINLVIADKNKITNKIESLHGLGFWNVIASAVIGKTVEHFAHKHLTNNEKQTLNGIEGFVRADKTENVVMPGTYKLKGEIGKILGDIQPYKYSIVLTGDPHAGKTEVVMQLANAFAEIGKTVGAFMLEQGGMESKDTKGAIDRNIKKENLQNVYITGEASKGIDSVKQYAKTFNVIIIDSWQKLGIPSTKFDSLRHEFPNTIFIVIFQQNGEGGTRGGVSADFDTPVALKVHKVDETFNNNYVEVKKNRGNGNTLSLKYMVKAKKTLSV